MIPIERAARALCSLDGQPENIKMDGKPMWQDYLPEVRAALQAIREPSDAMHAAVADEARRVSQPISTQHAWEAMIDAALAEGA